MMGAVEALNGAVLLGFTFATQAFHTILEMTTSTNGCALEHLDRAQFIDPEFPFARALAASCHGQRGRLLFR